MVCIFFCNALLIVLTIAKYDYVFTSQLVRVHVFVCVVFENPVLMHVGSSCQYIGQVGQDDGGGGGPRRAVFLINKFTIGTSCFMAAMNTLCSFPL